MTVTFRTFAEALDVALRDIRMRFTGASTAPGSVFNHQASVYVGQRMGATAYAKGRYAAVRPDMATGDDLIALAATHGITKYEATTVRRLVTVTNMTGAGVWLASQQATTESGLIFQVESAGAWTAPGAVVILVKSVSTGKQCNLPAGTTLTWTAPPVGMGATAIAGAWVDTIAARDAEKDSELQARLMGRMGGMPTSGNEAAFWAWLLSDDACRALADALYPPMQDAYVYPGIRGVLDVSTVPLLTWNGISKLPLAAAIVALEAFMDTVIPTGYDHDSILFTEDSTDFIVTLLTDSGYGRDWGVASTDTLTTHGATDCTAQRIYFTAAPSTQNLAVGKRLMVHVGTYFYPNVRTVTAVNNTDFYVDVDAEFVDESGDAAIPGHGIIVRPAGPISQACVDAVLAMFSRMTPSDTVDARRYPVVSQTHPVDVTTGMIHRSLLDASDRILDITVTTGTHVATTAVLAGGALTAYVVQPTRADDWCRVYFTNLNV